MAREVGLEAAAVQPRDVAGVHEVAYLVAAAEDDGGLALERALQEQRQDPPVPLALAVDDRVAEAGHRQAGGALARDRGVLLARQLADAVLPVRVGGVRLVLEVGRGLAVDPGRRRLDHFVDAELGRGLQHVQGPDRVRREVEHGVADRSGDLELCGLVRYRVVAARRVAEGVVVEDVAADDRDVAGDAVEVLVGAGREVVVDGDRRRPRPAGPGRSASRQIPRPRS